MKHHVPVLLDETIALLDIKPGGTYADLTMGLGGHTRRIIELAGDAGRVVGVDKDGYAIEVASERLAGMPGTLTIIRSDFRHAAEKIRAAGIEGLDGFLMDLGVSTMQLKTPERGFAFQEDAPLDMRMDTSSGITAAELIAESSDKELAGIIFRFGEERWARAIARRVVELGKTAPVDTTGKLASAVKDAIPRGAWPKSMHPATRTFQALRIAVNDELASLSEGLEDMLGLLASGGRAVVISYHSLEDRIVKQTFRRWEKPCTCPPDFPVCVCGEKQKLRLVTKSPVVASDEEVAANPSARSAKLRAAEIL